MDSHRSMRCSMCGVNWPPDMTKCPQCADDTWQCSAEVDGSSRLWKAAQRVDRTIPAIHPERIVEHNGQFWIHRQSLASLDIPMEVGTILRVSSRVEGGEDIYLELDAPAINPFGERNARLDGFWVNRINPEELRNVTPEDIIGEA